MVYVCGLFVCYNTERQRRKGVREVLLWRTTYTPTVLRSIDTLGILREKMHVKGLSRSSVCALHSPDTKVIRRVIVNTRRTRLHV